MGKHKKTKSKERAEIVPGYRCRGRAWIEKDGQTFIGFGRIVLLERIGEYGSISQAAKSMQMSYKHAWDLLDSMNRNAARPLLVTNTGGKGGGGTELTAEGEKVIRRFYELQERLTTFMQTETERFLADF